MQNGLKNGFNKKILSPLYDSTTCFDCGGNQGVDFHHIMGRDGYSESGVLNSSPLNACPLCRNCHTPEYRSHHGKPPLSDPSVQAKLLSRILTHLRSQDYLFTSKDYEFYRKYHHAYPIGTVLTSPDGEEVLRADD